MTWYWATLIIIGWIIGGTVTARYYYYHIEPSESDESGAGFAFLVWPLFAMLFVALRLWSFTLHFRADSIREKRYKQSIEWLHKKRQEKDTDG